MKSKQSALSVAILASLLLASNASIAATLEEVVVTARKQAESLVDTPVAVSVLGAEFFEKSGFTTMTDVVKFVPGFDYSPTSSVRANGTRIRGIRTASYSEGFESSVAVVIDGVVMAREAAGFFDLYDIESVEVIKGPQGTLFGKNASAGVINVRTKQPEYEFSGGGDIMFGTYGERRIRGSVTGPLIDDTLAYRITGSTNENDGVIDNKYAGENDVNSKDTWSLRAKFLYEPTDQLSATLTLDTVKEDNKCCIATWRTSGDDIGLIGAAYTPNALQLQEALDLAGITAGAGNRSVAIFEDRINQESEANGVALQLSYDLGETQLTSITAWRDYYIDEFNEADQLSNTDLNNRNGTEADSEQISQEFRLTGNINDAVSYVAGLYYFNEDIDADGSIYVELGAFGLFNSRTRSIRSVETTNLAAFGEVNWDLTDKFTLIVGGRFSDEEKDATFSRMGTSIDPNLPFATLFSGDYIGAQNSEDTNFSGRVIGRYNITDNVNTYVAWSRGYKGPGFDVGDGANGAFANETGGLPFVDAEVPTLIEIGFKGWFLDNTLSVNTALFHQSTEDLQTIRALPNGGVSNLAIGEVVSDGFEADFMYLTPVEGLTITGSLTYLDVVYEEFLQEPELEGENFEGVPEWAYSLIANYDFQLGDGGWSGFARAEYSWQDDKNASTGNTERTLIEDYGLLNIRAGLTSPSKKYSATLAVENATDEDYPYWIGGSTFSALGSTATSQYLGPDRIVRLTLGAKF
ncbi:putative TonB-dependent receptor protein [marine gamma proteobacterium HTCC2143]|uniref:Putative TonB-dependent receptor protein n=1 Tax=marine gamma proteobacterium HTCC2143 TaxID=247633 RepID=A0YDP5_9GAMM|nr:putative TonB-dependent receptor protein [marine gamma proteobacterium HTCC2143]